MAAVDPVAKDIVTQQTRLKTVPGDWTAWAGLAADYVQEARITADPTYYPKADGAVARSLQIQPHDNFLALTGQGGRSPRLATTSLARSSWLTRRSPSTSTAPSTYGDPR